MKTKEEILRHLERTGYENFAIERILGFLLGNNTVERNEKVMFHKGKGSFDDFFEWFNEKPEKNVFVDIAANLDFLLSHVREGSVTENIISKTKKNVQFLVDNKEYLMECVEKREIFEKMEKDLDEILLGVNKTLESLINR